MTHAFLRWLTAAGFGAALKGALRAAQVLGTNETPAPLTTAATSAQDCANPHVYAVRALRAYTGGGPDLIWYGAAGNRAKAAITGFGILDGFAGVLVRDDYGGYLSYDAGLAGVQQCLAHIYRYLDDAYTTGPASQVWTRQAGDDLREAAAAVRAARAGNRASLDPALLARLRHSYHQAVAFGISVNLSRPSRGQWPTAKTRPRRTGWRGRKKEQGTSSATSPRPGGQLKSPPPSRPKDGVLSSMWGPKEPSQAPPATVAEPHQATASFVPPPGGYDPTGECLKMATMHGESVTCPKWGFRASRSATGMPV